MKEENEKALEEFLKHADSIGDDITDEISEILGMVPYIIPVLREREDVFALSTLADERICRPKNLSPKTAELVTIAAAAGMGAEGCLKVHIRAAVKEGASRDEIYDTLMIASMIGKTKILASSLRQMRDAFTGDSK